ncbi:MAG: hypothetical protein Q9191_001185 [Dirinaria sp. TL-2023a]
MQAETPVPVPGPRVELKPIIKEIVRTQVCFPNVRLLVDKISIITLSGAQPGNNEAFHLLLTDGEKYVVMEDFYSIGQDRRLPAANETLGFGVADRARSLHEMVVESLTPSVDPGQFTEADPPAKKADFQKPSGTGENIEHAGFEEIFDTAATLPKSQSSNARTPMQKKRKRDIALGEIDPNFGSISKTPSKRIKDQKGSSPLQDSFSTARSWLLESSTPETALQQRSDFSTGSLDVSSKILASQKCISSNEPVHWKSLHSADRLSVAPERRTVPLPIERPLNVQPLAKFRGYHRRNDIYDVFAVVQWVGESVIKRSRMPPKRDIRIVDPSTDKKVLLSVFVEPERFTPTVGTVALIRSVTTHEWDGGMLNIYPKQCEGKHWFIPNPKGFEGCNVEAMRGWWKEMLAKETDEKSGN